MMARQLNDTDKIKYYQELIRRRQKRIREYVKQYDFLYRDYQREQIRTPVANTRISTKVDMNLRFFSKKIYDRKVPITSKPNDVIDNYKNGQLEQRRIYDENSHVKFDIDFSDHGNSKLHPNVPHIHKWHVDSKSGKIISRDSGRPLSAKELKLIKDVNKNDK